MYFGGNDDVPVAAVEVQRGFGSHTCNAVEIIMTDVRLLHVWVMMSKEVGPYVNRLEMISPREGQKRTRCQADCDKQRA